MSGGLLRNIGITRVLCKNSTTNLIPRSHIHNHNPNPFIRNQSKKHDTFPSSFTSPSCSSFCSASSSSSSSPKVGLVGWYLGMIKSRPVLTKAVSSSLIYIAADCSSQALSRSPSDAYDFVRTCRMAAYGLLIMGPSLHYWYNFMSRVFPKRDLVTTFIKMGMGQAVYGPIMTVIFFSSNAYLQGENITEIIARLKRDLIPTLLNGVMFWPICDFITFRYVPVHLQPLVSNSFAYLWTIFLTYKASLGKASATASS